MTGQPPTLTENARTHAHAGNGYRNAWAFPPGGVVLWSPASYRARAAAAIVKADPARAMRLAADCGPEAPGLLITVGDAWAERGQLDQAAAAYSSAQRQAHAQTRPEARLLEAAAWYGMALAAWGRGDLWGALCAVDEGLDLAQGGPAALLRAALAGLGDAITLAAARRPLECP